jgi:hypothetical protein
MAKKNLRKIPPAIQTRLQRLGNQDVVAGISRKYTAADLASGKLKHLGVQLLNDGLEFPESVAPPAASGKYSDRNLNGYEVVRKDLPKETHYNTVEAPDWGDSSNGTHPVDLPYEKYPRDFHGPHQASIKINSPNRSPGQSEYTLVFEVDEVLKQQGADFEVDLLSALNLLQENVGSCGVQKSGATFADYMKSMTVNWEVLPPGTKEEALQRLFRNRQPTPQEKATVEERYDFLMGLNPQKLVYGMSGIQRYFGALIQGDLIVFENIEYGNAIYIMFENWQELSKRSRTELMSGRFGKNFERIPHGSGWKDKVKTTIQSARKSTKVATK